MLLNLNIKNYALIEELSIELSPGLNIFTGETGAGKSIIIESLGLILGGRASSDIVRKDSSRCFISAEFDCSKYADLNNLLEDSGLGTAEDETIIIRREIDSSGKSRAFVNDRPSSVETLKNIGELLVDVHGQHEHQALFKPVLQKKLLDNFAGNEILLGELKIKYSEYKKLIALRDSRQMSEQERERLTELYSFQQKEINSAKLTHGEEEEIEQLLPKLKNADKLLAQSGELYDILYSSEGSVLERLGKIRRILETINAGGGNLAETSDGVGKAYYLLEEASREIENFKDNLRLDPEEFNRLLERQDLISKLKRKYGSTIPDVLAYCEKISAELETISKADQNKLELERNIATVLESLEVLCKTLTSKRKKAAERLSAGIEKELADLGMKKARFEISIQKEPEPSSDGWDKLEFMFSANPGEDIKPLREIASGGEISRVMLAIKTVLAKSDSIPVLVFDEIDSGIGGPMGQTIGKKLSALSKHHQILCITHLPQIAAFASSHMAVSKETTKNITRTSIKKLSENDSLEEISRMLSGHEITPTARKHAAELIETARK